MGRGAFGPFGAVAASGVATFGLGDLTRILPPILLDRPTFWGLLAYPSQVPAAPPVGDATNLSRVPALLQESNSCVSSP
jgi:hypothetical protein